MKLSIIIPVYNGAATIRELVTELNAELASRFDLEVLLVNDASPSDNSAEVCEEIALRNRWVTFLDLSRNFGEHNAVMVGLNFCTGDGAVILDDDFQNPPSEVARLVDKLNEGYDVVYSRYEKKRHAGLRNLGSSFNNLVATILIGKPRDLYLSSFKAITRFVIDELVKYTGPYPYIDGLILRVTRNYTTVLVEHRPREVGTSGYSVRKLVSLWLNMFTNFSILPLRVATILGFGFATLGLVGATIFLIEKIRHPDLPAGWPSLIISLFVISGVQLFALGVVGEYLGRLFMKDNGNPQFVVRKAINCRRPKDDA
ncbi:MAG: glycosyltransferase family 2 protein [Candidatus Marinimicrobia bacterium]|nr:glycosyltransferase family 2 protein [Candidatus Neomarinimicrobiota bacterium]